MCTGACRDASTRDTLRLTVLMVFSLALGACDDPPRPTMSGRWETESNRLVFTATEEDRVVEGIGTVAYADPKTGGTVLSPITVKGMNEYPDVTLALIASHGFVLAFSGRFFGPDSIVGEVVGFSDGTPTATLIRQ